MKNIFGVMKIFCEWMWMCCWTSCTWSHQNLRHETMLTLRNLPIFHLTSRQARAWILKINTKFSRFFPELHRLCHMCNLRSDLIISSKFTQTLSNSLTNLRLWIHDRMREVEPTTSKQNRESYENQRKIFNFRFFFLVIFLFDRRWAQKNERRKKRWSKSSDNSLTSSQSLLISSSVRIPAR